MTTERTASAEETEALGEAMAADLRAGDVVLVGGDLGAGKTTFIRGACRGLGVTAPVTSPTFTIGHLYPGRVPVAHLDLYRLADLGQEDPALLEDYVDRPERRPDRVAGGGRAGARAGHPSRRDPPPGRRRARDRVRLSG